MRKIYNFILKYLKPKISNFLVSIYNHLSIYAYKTYVDCCESCSLTWKYFIRDFDLGLDVPKILNDFVSWLNSVIASVLRPNFRIDAEIKLFLILYWIWICVHMYWYNITFKDCELFINHYLFLIGNEFVGLRLYATYFMSIIPSWIESSHVHKWLVSFFAVSLAQDFSVAYEMFMSIVRFEIIDMEKWLWLFSIVSICKNFFDGLAMMCWKSAPIAANILNQTVICNLIAIYLPTIILVILLLYFLLYSKENPLKSKKFIQWNIQIVIIYISLWIFFIKNIYIDYNILLDSDWTSAHYIFTTEYSLSYYFYVWTLLIFMLIFLYMLNLCMEGVHTISLTMIYVLLLNLQGNILILSCDNLMLLFLGMEIQALSIYTLIVLGRNTNKSAEACLKFFIWGSVSGGLLLYGISLLYAGIGTVNMEELKVILPQDIGTFGNLSFSIEHFALVCFSLILVGILFKLGVVPVHFWIIDVFEGTSLMNVMIIALVTKLPLIYFLLKIFVVYHSYFVIFSRILVMLSIITIFYGVIESFFQNTIKSFFAYSSIGHMGYILLGLSLGSVEGAGSSIFYLLMYIWLTFSFFYIILMFKYKKEIDKEWNNLENLNQLSLMYKKVPVLGIMFCFIMFASAGLPPFGGFLSKYYLLQALMESNEIFLSVLVVLASIVSCVSYLRVIRICLFGDVPKEYNGISVNVKVNYYFISAAWVLFLVSIWVVVNHSTLLVILYSLIEAIVYS